MKDSLKKLLKKFPVFLDKNPGSNFYRSESVFNEHYKAICDDLLKTYVGEFISKPVMIHRVQSEPHQYSIHVDIDFTGVSGNKFTPVYHTEDGDVDVVDPDRVQTPYPERFHLKSVQIYKNEDLYSSKTYNYKDEVCSDSFVIEQGSVDTVPVVPFTVEVETYEEHTFKVGFPENDIAEGNIFDHDVSLDKLGAFLDLPRRVYESVPDEWADQTTPPYHPILLQPADGSLHNPYPAFNTLQDESGALSEGDKTYYRTEDDYHYSRRIAEYAIYYHTVPLPSLEIWKLFGLDLDKDISLKSRKNQLLKMYEERLHEDPYWAPLPWEHKDIQCTQLRKNLFLFVIVDNYEPFVGEDVFFKFMIMDCAGNDVEGDWLIVPYLAGMRFGDDVIDDYKWVCSTDDMDKLNPNVFNFKAFRTQEEIDVDFLVTNGVYEEHENDVVSDDIIIRVRGCSDARWFVSHCIGDDNNDGESPETPFKTIQKALDVCYDNDIIALLSPVFHLPDVLHVHTSCIIAYCGEGSEGLLIPPDCEVFQVHNDFGRYTTDLTLAMIRMRNRCCEIFSKINTFSNDNDRETRYNPLRIEIRSPYFKEPIQEPNSSRICRDIVEFDMNHIPSIHAGESITAHGYVHWRKRKTRDWQTFANAPLQVWINGELVEEITADENGNYSWTCEYDTWVDQVIKILFVETDDLCRWQTLDTYRVYHLLQLFFNELDEWMYRTSNDTLALSLYDDSYLGFSLDDEIDHMDFWVNLNNGDLFADWNYPDFDLEDEDTSIRGKFYPYCDGDTYFRVDYDDDRIWYHKEDGCKPVPANEAKTTPTELLLEGDSLIFSTEWPISLRYDAETGDFILNEEDVIFDPELQPNWEFETFA